MNCVFVSIANGILCRNKLSGKSTNRAFPLALAILFDNGRYPCKSVVPVAVHFTYFDVSVAVTAPQSSFGLHSISVDIVANKGLLSLRFDMDIMCGAKR